MTLSTIAKSSMVKIPVVGSVLNRGSIWVEIFSPVPSLVSSDTGIVVEINPHWLGVEQLMAFCALLVISVAALTCLQIN